MTGYKGNKHNLHGQYKVLKECVYETPVDHYWNLSIWDFESEKKNIYKSLQMFKISVTKG